MFDGWKLLIENSDWNTVVREFEKLGLRPETQDLEFEP